MGAAVSYHDIFPLMMVVMVPAVVAVVVVALWVAARANKMKDLKQHNILKDQGTSEQA